MLLDTTDVHTKERRKGASERIWTDGWKRGRADWGIMEKRERKKERKTIDKFSRSIGWDGMK